MKKVPIEGIGRVLSHELQPLTIFSDEDKYIIEYHVYRGGMYKTQFEFTYYKKETKEFNYERLIDILELEISKYKEYRD